jgi:hypothetical protein
MGKTEKKSFWFLDIYICCVYYPLSCSANTQSPKHDIHDYIEKDIIKYQKLGKILLCGDFNARISNTPDYIVDDSNQYIPIHSDYLIDKALLQRKNQDKILDARGKDLLDLCISNQLRVLNGRVLGAMFGSYTCDTPNGTCTVDYVLVSESILDQILYFRVSNFIPTLSDTHCKLEWGLLAKYKQENISYDNILHPMSPNYIWVMFSLQ